MRAVEGLIVGMGLAMVDEKIRHSNINLPQGKDLINFLKDRETITQTGGVTPNIMNTLILFSPQCNARLLACVGEDQRGFFYKEQTHKNLGPLQVYPSLPTGVVVSVVDNQGKVVNRDRYLGAAQEVKVNEKIVMDEKTLFVSDITTLRLTGVSEEANKIFIDLKKVGGSFFLNLAGFNPAIARREDLLFVVNNLHKTPDIVTANEEELSYFSNSTDFEKSIKNTFPNARILVVTQAEKGSILRFQNELINIPSFEIKKELVVDETGAGDTYAGLMLGVLYTKPYTEWTKDHITFACQVAAFGASLIVQTANTRLSEDNMALVKNFLKISQR